MIDENARLKGDKGKLQSDILMITEERNRIAKLLDDTLYKLRLAEAAA